VIDPNGQKRATAKVRESQVDKIRRGMKARVRVDGFPTQLFDGTVDDVAALPDARASAQVYSKVYTTHVLLDNEVPGLRPGMPAEVEFLLANRENAIAVPVQAILRYEGKPHVAVRKPGGDIDLRAVSVGLSSDKVIEITQGIASGDDVILNPAAFLGDNAKAPATRSPTSSESSQIQPDRKP
jgi:HlyD family secretion protein